MSEQLTQEAFENYFTKELATSEMPALKYAFSNTLFEPDHDTKEPYVTFYVMPAVGSQISLGPRPYFRERGIIQHDIYTALGVGDEVWRKIADVLTGIWRQKCFSSDDGGTITVETPVVRLLGGEGEWFHVVFEVPYSRTET